MSDGTFVMFRDKRKKIIALVLVVLAVVALILISMGINNFLRPVANFNNASRKPQDEVSVEFYTSNESLAQLTLEVADTAEERRRGLMGCKELKKDGMFFIFPEEKQLSFWMKNTSLPLDIIFVNRSGRVVNVEQAVPQPHSPEEDLIIYQSQGFAQYVVETRRGFAEEVGIVPGVSIDWRRRKY